MITEIMRLIRFFDGLWFKTQMSFPGDFLRTSELCHDGSRVQMSNSFQHFLDLLLPTRTSSTLFPSARVSPNYLHSVAPLPKNPTRRQSITLTFSNYLQRVKKTKTLPAVLSLWSSSLNHSNMSSDWIKQPFWVNPAAKIPRDLLLMSCDGSCDRVFIWTSR